MCPPSCPSATHPACTPQPQSLLPCSHRELTGPWPRRPGGREAGLCTHTTWAQALFRRVLAAGPPSASGSPTHPGRREPPPTPEPLRGLNDPAEGARGARPRGNPQNPRAGHRGAARPGWTTAREQGTGRPEGRAGHQWGPRAPDSSQHKWPKPGSFTPLPCRRLHPLQPPWSPDLTLPAPGTPGMTTPLALMQGALNWDTAGPQPLPPRPPGPNPSPIRAEGAGWGMDVASGVPPPPRRGQGGQFREGGHPGEGTVPGKVGGRPARL